MRLVLTKAVCLYQEMEAVMTDLNTVLEGSISRPASYPPELIEQVSLPETRDPRPEILSENPKTDRDIETRT